MPNEYSMMFRLSAKLGSEFAGTFGKAQRALEETQKEIRELARVQTDVSAYQKQQAAVEQTAQKLELLQKQYDNIQREISETEGYSSSLENKLLDKQHAIDKATQSYERSREKLDEMGQSLREAGIDTDNLGDESKKLADRQDELAEQYAETRKEAEKFGQSGTSAFEAVGDALIAAGVLNSLKELAVAYKECVEISMTFGAELSSVEALSGASAEEMENLRKKAQEIGATTKYTATEGAQAMSYMGMAGWDASQMIDGLDGVINLAAASGEDLAQVSDIVTDNLTAFGMAASQTARFADVLAATATGSNTSVSVMGETFKKAGPVAGALGYSIEDVSVAIGLMANAGVKGSRAGTALSNTFTGLLGGIKLTGEAIGEVEFNTVKADGTMMDFGETINSLRAYFNRLSEAEKVSNAQAIAGKQGYAGLLAILNATDADYIKLTDSINNCSGAAEKMAKIRMDNLQGDVTLLQSAADGLKTTLGGAFEPELRKLAKVGADILSSVNGFLQRNPVLMKALLGITGVLGAALAAYVTYKSVKTSVNALRKVSTLLTVKETAATAAEATATEGATVAQRGFNAALASNPIGLVLTGLAALTVALIAIGAKTKAEMDDLLKDAKALEEATNEYKNTLSSLNEEYDGTIGKAELQSEAALGYIARLKELESAGLKTAEQQQEYANILATLHSLMPDLNLEIDEQTGLLKKGADELERQVEAWKEKIKIQALENLSTKVMETQIEFTYQRDKAQKAYEEAQADAERLHEAYRKAHSGHDIDAGALAAQSALYGGYRSGIEKEILDNLVLQQELEKNLTAAQEALDGNEKEVRAITEAYAEAANNASLFSNEVVGTGEAVSNTGPTIEEISDKLAEMAQQYDEAYQLARDSMEKQFSLWEEADKVIPTKIRDINSALNSQKDYWANYTDNLNTLLSKAGEIDGLREMLSQFADGSKDSVNAVAGMAKASDEDLARMVQNWKDLQEQQDLAAGALAEVRTGYGEELLNMQDDMANAIDGLDLSDASEVAAKNTIDAYIAALQAGTTDAVTTAQRLGRLVTAALNGSLKSWNLAQNAPQNYASEYAEGTDNAARGWAWVGEKGPELMWMNGGETVIPHDRSEAIMSERRGSPQITIAPVFNIESNGDMDGTLERATDMLVERVVSAIGETGIDAQRGAYS